MDVKVINANEEEVTPDMLKAIVNVIQCQDGELPLGAKAVEYIEKHNLHVAFMPIAAAKQVLLAAAMQEAHLSEAAESEIDNSLIMGRGLNLRTGNEFKDYAGPNIEEAEGSTSVYKSSATQPVRQVNVQTGLFGEEQITLGKLMNWYSEESLTKVPQGLKHRTNSDLGKACT